MLNKAFKRHRRAAKSRARIRLGSKVRLCVYRSLQHLYAQLIVREAQGDQVLLSVSTLDKELKAGCKGKLANNVQTASIVGAILARRAKEKKIQQVAFDRSGYKYHGRIKALAEAARAGGLEF